jgi:hypothetical protein
MAASRRIIAMKRRKIDDLWIYIRRPWSMDAVQPAHSACGASRPPRACVGLGEGAGEGVATAILDAGDASGEQAAMTSDAVREKCLEMINRLLDQGFERPIFFSAIDIDGLTTTGSSETVTSAAQPLVATSGPFTMYLPPINVLLVDPKGRVAHGVIDGSGAASCRVLP